MSDILCIYYSRTGNTRRAVKAIAADLGAEIVAISDEEKRGGWRGYIRCGMDAMRTSTRPLKPFETERPLDRYKLIKFMRSNQATCIIVGSPVWGGRMAAPVRALLKRRGLEMKNVAYVVTRSTTQRSEEVYEQMDRYTAAPHVAAVSLWPGSEGYEFWRGDFVQNVRRLLAQQ